MTIQKIIERLLRSRLYHTGVVIKTDVGQSGEVLVQDVCYQGSRSFVVVAETERPEAAFCIPLAKIQQVTGTTEAA